MRGSYTVILVFVVISLLGVLAFPRIPVRFGEAGGENSLRLTYRWLNAAPQAMERQVTAPLEGIMGTIQGVKSVTSLSGYNDGSIILSLDKMVNLDYVRFEASSLVRQIYRSLPVGVSYPVISLNNFTEDESSKPLLTLQFNGAEASGKLMQYINSSLKPRLAKIEGIGSVDVHGIEPDEWIVEYKPEVIRSLAIKEDDIRAAISKNGLQGSLGWIPAYEESKQSISLSSSDNDLRNVIVASKDNRIIRLSDIATINKREKTADSYFRIDGKNALQIALMPQANINQLTVAGEVKKKLGAIASELPSGYYIRIDYDATEQIYDNIEALAKHSAIAFFGIMLLVVVFFNNWKISVLVTMALVASLLLSALVIYLLGIVVHVPSLASVVILIGIICGYVLVSVDQFRQRQNRFIIISIIGSTLIMSVSLSVICFLQEELRASLADFAKIFLVGQWVSVFVCLWLIPALVEKMDIHNYKRGTYFVVFFRMVRDSYCHLLNLLFRFRRTTISVCVLMFGLPLYALPIRLEEHSSFSIIYNHILGDGWYLQNVRPILDKGLGGISRLFSEFVYEKSYRGSRDQTALYITAGLPNHSTLEQMDMVLNRMESELRKYHEIERFIARVYNGQQGNIVVYFKKPYDNGQFPKQLKSKIIAMSTEMSGIDWKIYGLGRGFNLNVNENGTTSFNVSLTGYSYTELDRIVRELQKRLLANPRIQEVDVNKVPGFYSEKDLYAYKIYTDPLFWSNYDVSIHSLYGAIEKFNTHPQSDLYQLFGSEYLGVNIMPESVSGFDVIKLRNEPLPVSDSISLKIHGQTQIVKEKIIPNIRKENQQYLRQISFEYMGDEILGGRFLGKVLGEFQHELPMGYSAEQEFFGNWKLDSTNQYKLIALSMVFIFLITAIMFESIRQPFSLIASIALSFVGLFITFYSMNVNFDQGGYASFLLVIGLASFPVVTVMNEYNFLLREFGGSRLDTYKKAIMLKFEFILYYACGIFISMLPFLLYSSEEFFWYSLTVGVIGGVGASVVVVLFFVPMILINQNSNKLG